ncbi:MAG: hypothetical protein QCI82_08940 [Candidatus Thermoplasmatota archaeon]|nr:hypothetical protein [Candidatus Thermoplasmatota archaeon]
MGAGKKLIRLSSLIMKNFIFKSDMIKKTSKTIKEYNNYRSLCNFLEDYFVSLYQKGDGLHEYL